jgi:hypothetical protein
VAIQDLWKSFLYLMCLNTFGQSIDGSKSQEGKTPHPLPPFWKMFTTFLLKWRRGVHRICGFSWMFFRRSPESLGCRSSKHETNVLSTLQPPFDRMTKKLTCHSRPRTSEAMTTNTIGTSQRRSCRVRFKIQLFVYGNTLQGRPFLEEAYTIEINADGALIAMKTSMPSGERLLLINPSNERTQECTVLAVRARQGQGVQDAVAVEFGAPAPEFWRRLAR